MKLTFVGQKTYVFTYGASFTICDYLDYGTDSIGIKLLREIFLRHQNTSVRLVWDGEVAR